MARHFRRAFGTSPDRTHELTGCDQIVHGWMRQPPTIVGADAAAARPARATLPRRLFFLYFQRNSSCCPDGQKAMKRVVVDHYGGPELLKRLSLVRLLRRFMGRLLSAVMGSQPR